MPNHKSSAYMISQHYAVIWHAIIYTGLHNTIYCRHQVLYYYLLYNYIVLLSTVQRNVILFNPFTRKSKIKQIYALVTAVKL